MHTAAKNEAGWVGPIELDLRNTPTAALKHKAATKNMVVLVMRILFAICLIKRFDYVTCHVMNIIVYIQLG